MSDFAKHAADYSLAIIEAKAIICAPNLAVLVATKEYLVVEDKLMEARTALNRAIDANYKLHIEELYAKRSRTSQSNTSSSDP